MNYELAFFESYLQQKIRFRDNASISKELYEQELAQLKAETDLVKHQMMLHVFHYADHTALEIYIQQHQTALIGLADQLLTLIGTEHLHRIYQLSKSPSSLNLCKIFYQYLEELIQYIERNFGRYFSKDIKAPEGYRILAAREMQEKESQIRQELARWRVPDTLLQLLFAPIEAFIQEGKGTHISYRRLIYFKEVLQELEQMLSEPQPGISMADRLESLLHYLNFNSEAFIEYCTADYRTKLKEAGSLHEEIQILSQLIKENNQIQIRPEVSLVATSIGLKEELNYWLRAELHHCEQRLRFVEKENSNVRQQANSTKTEEAGNLQKVSISIPVSQVAYLLKLMVETKLLAGASQIAIIRVIAANFNSARNEPISADSMRSKYFNPDKGTAQAVRDLLLSLVHFSKKQMP